MATLRLSYGSSTAIVVTLASLAASSARQSTLVDNTGNTFVDAIVQVRVKLASGTPSGDRAVYIYAYGSEDGTDLTDNATGTDGAITLRQPSNLRLLGAIDTPDSGGLSYVSHPMSLMQAFGGFGLPRKWGIVVHNLSGVAFSATEGDHRKGYTGIYFQTV